MDIREFSEFLDFTRYFYDRDFADVIDEVMNLVRMVALTNVLPLLVAFSLIRAVYQYMTKNNGKPGVDPGEIIRIFGLVILVGISPELIRGLGTIVDGTTTSFAYTRTEQLDEFVKWNTVKEVKDRKGLSEDQATELYTRLNGNPSDDRDAIDRYLQELKSSDDPSGNVFNAVGEAATELVKIGENLRGMFSNMLMTMLSSNVMSLLALVKLALGALIFVFGVVLQVLAPLAFAFDLVFPGKATKFMAVWLSVKFSFLTFLVIEAIVMGFFAMAQSGMATDASFSLTYNIIVVSTFMVAIVCYLLVFWFTSKYVGSGEAGRFLSQTVAGMAFIANSALKGAQGLAKTGGAPGGSGN